MTEIVYAIVDSDNVVENVIVADKKFIDKLPTDIASDNVDSGTLSENYQYVDITNKSPRPSVGWTRTTNGKFVAPPEIPSPIPVDDPGYTPS